MDDHGQVIIDAIRSNNDLPKEAKTVAFALTHLFVSACNDLKRIADALEKRPMPSKMPVTVPLNPWHAWDGKASRPVGRDPSTTVRVQFWSKPDHVETYRLDSSEIDWTDVTAYQIINNKMEN